MAALALSLGLAPAAAMAYIDPGNGAYMVQALFAFIGAAIFYLRHPVRALKSAWNWLAHDLLKIRRAPLAEGLAERGDQPGLD